MAESFGGGESGGKKTKSKRSPGNTTQLEISKIVEIFQSRKEAAIDTSSQTSKPLSLPRMGRRHSDDPTKILQAHHSWHHSTVEESTASKKGRKKKARSKPGSKKTSLHDGCGNTEGKSITTSGTSSSMCGLLPLKQNNTEDEGINMQLSTSTSEGPEACSWRSRNSASMYSSTSSLGHRSNNSEDVDDYKNEIIDCNDEDLENNSYAATTLQATSQDDSETPTPPVVAPSLHVRLDFDSESTSTPVESHYHHIIEYPEDPTMSKPFPSQQSHDMTGDSFPFHTLTPHQETIEGAGLYDDNINRLPASENEIADAEKRELKEFTDILKTSTAAIVQDNFERVNAECNKIVGHYQTQYQSLKQEYEAEKRHLSGQIERGKDRRQEDIFAQSILSAEVKKNREEISKLHKTTQQFQEMKDEVREMRSKLKEKEDELQLLRVDVGQRRKEMGSIVPICADPKLLEEMSRSEECFALLMRLMPDERKIRDELTRYKYRTEARPATK